MTWILIVVTVSAQYGANVVASKVFPSYEECVNAGSSMRLAFSGHPQPYCLPANDVKPILRTEALVR